jgi:hypothetical protein
VRTRVGALPPSGRGGFPVLPRFRIGVPAAFDGERGAVDPATGGRGEGAVAVAATVGVGAGRDGADGAIGAGVEGSAGTGVSATATAGSTLAGSIGAAGSGSVCVSAARPVGRVGSV